MDTTTLAAVLRERWGLVGYTCTQLSGGMNSRTWDIAAGSHRYVAKHVTPARLSDLVDGCVTAEALSDAGLTTGRPVRTGSGALLSREHRLALFDHVPGRELDGGTGEEQRRIAQTLAAVHTADIHQHAGRDDEFFALLDPAAPGVDQHPWLITAIRAALAETRTLAVTWSVLHTDPAPEAFRYDAGTGRTGLVDWAGARRGPVLYDVASAVMYLGGPGRAAPFLAAYTAGTSLPASELQHLDAFRRFRWAVQGAYFAGRLAANDLTGVDGQRDNERGLVDAYQGLADLFPEANREHQHRDQ